MVRTNPTLRSLAVLAMLLAVCCAGTAYLRANLSRPVLPEGRMPTARLLWTKPAPYVHSMGFSSSGRYITAVSKGGRIQCYDSSGALLFDTIVPGTDRAVVSSDGSCTLAYAHMNRANTRLTFLDAGGRVQWQTNVPGAIWSVDAVGTRGEARFALGTGSRHVYLVSLKGASKRYRRWRAPGAVCSVSLSSDCEKVAYGTWQQSSVCRSDVAGHKDWELDADGARLHYVQALDSSDRLFIRAIPNRRDADGQAWLAEPDGTLGKELLLAASQRTSAMASPDGNYICTGYTKSIAHSGKSTPEKHAALYDHNGRRLWDKGSLLFPVVPIQVMEGGYVLVAGAKNAVLAISPSGEVRQTCQLPAAVTKSTTSRDGLRSLLLCADGKLRLLQAIP